MRVILSLALAAFLSVGLQAQDTTWVQTFTFDTIVSRRANFEFPASLDNQRFEKVLMYYKLKCSPLTTWDNYNCGEWDYLTYTRIFDHTGLMDSVHHEGSRYRVNTLSPQTTPYKATPFYDQQWRIIQTRAQNTVTTHAVGSGAAAALPFVNAGTNGTTLQWIITAAELNAASVTAGNLQGMSFAFQDAAGGLQNVKVRLKATSATALTAWETTGFTTVFDNNLYGLAAGAQTFDFGTPFLWNGTSNIVVELSVADAYTAAAAIVLAGQETAAGSVATFNNHNGVFRTTAANFAELNMSNVDLGSDVTMTFWAKGNGSFGTNTSVLEALDSLGNRILNIHLPANDQIYFDAGGQNGYDRIQKVTTAADIDNNWHHWAFVKKTSTGQMFIYKDGVLWHSGTGLTRPVGRVAQFFFGSNADHGYTYKGDLDEFTLWTTALDAATIAAWKDKKVDVTHPAYASLELYYDFDDVAALADKSGNDRLGMCSQSNMIAWSAYPVAGRQAGNIRPEASFIQGTYAAAETDSVLSARFLQPDVFFEYEEADNSFHVIDNQLIYKTATIDTLASNGQVLASAPSGQDNVLNNETLIYFEPPFELVNDVEIGRYITPYGIGFDLGPQGFTWIYDVTDYQKYLHGMVDLAAHNTQELIDLKFAFIEGTPPRDVHDIAPIWSNFRSYQFSDMANDNVLSATPFALSDTSEMFKIKTRFSGHGQVGNGACCEWVPNDHQILIDGIPRFSWNIWQETECGTNPNIGQGGTWVYAREGWCPGDMVKEHDHELTEYVTPGDTISIDYDINDVPANDPGQAGGNYIVAMDLVSYSAPNFQHDAALLDVLNPNNWEYYGKWNPTCSNPRVIIQNTGEQPLTSCKVRCWVSEGNYAEFNWTGNLGFLEKEMVEIPVTTWFWYGANADGKFHAEVYDVQGQNLDEYAQNNTFTTKYEAPETINGPFFVWFTTNNKAVENKWKLIDGEGTTIFERTSLTNSTEYKDTFNLAPGCYSIILEDSDHDGISFWYSAQVEGETGGQFRLRKVGGGYIEFFPGDFGAYHRYNFTVGFTVNTDEQELPDTELLLFPNPASEQVRVEFNGNLGKTATVEIIDGNGRILKSLQATTEGNYLGVDIPVAELNTGFYFVRVHGTEGTKTARFTKQ